MKTLNWLSQVPWLKEIVQYKATLNQARQTAQEGQFQQAIALLEPALARSSRSDGNELLAKLRRVIKGKEHFRDGLMAEQANDLDGAVVLAEVLYKEALEFLPELTECQMRLGIIALKTEQWGWAITYLNGIEGEHAAYLRGFAYAQQGKFQQANREWRQVPHIQTQRKILKTLFQRDQLQRIQKVEQLVDRHSLQQAKIASQKFLQKFGSHPLVEENLDSHIQARLDTAVWQDRDWQETFMATEQAWLERQDITSLHNLAVAAYYRAQAESEDTIPESLLVNLIIAWTTALANIHLDPSLLQVPWMGNNSVDLNEIASALKQEIEQFIDAVRDKDLEQYLRLRDRYRLEMTTLHLIGNSPACGVRMKKLLLLPGYYERYCKKSQNFSLPAQLWGTLYTAWGPAVAACLEGDIVRAVQIKPVSKPVTQAEVLGQQFVAYYEGCYHLQNQHWHQAVFPLQQAQAEIKKSADWCEEMDRLCGIQRQLISEFSEHLEFAQFWYDLLGSQLARSYLAEYRVEQVQEWWVKEQITDKQALEKLKKIKQIDSQNPILADLLNAVETKLELDEIDRLLKAKRWEEAISRAKRSGNSQVKYCMAEFFLKFGAESQGLDFEAIYQLGRWAYELCPNEPSFQEVYRQLRLCY